MHEIARYSDFCIISENTDSLSVYREGGEGLGGKWVKLNNSHHVIF